MQEILNKTIQEIKEQKLATTKEWNRYAVNHNLLSAETTMYLTNKKYNELIEKIA